MTIEEFETELASVLLAGKSADINRCYEREISTFPDVLDGYRHQKFVKEYCRWLIAQGDVSLARDIVAQHPKSQEHGWLSLFEARGLSNRLNIDLAKDAWQSLLSVETFQHEALAALGSLLLLEPDVERIMSLEFRVIRDMVKTYSFDQHSEFRRLYERILSTPKGAELAPLLLKTRENNIVFKVVQTADTDKYFPMLIETMKTNKLFCQCHGGGYEAFLGVKRGYYSWQATFNRIVLLSEHLASGYSGWILYLDADAFVADPKFDIKSYLSLHSGYSLIGVSGASAGPWDINSGVLFFNFGTSSTVQIVKAWSAAFHMTVKESDLQRAETPWSMGIDDQSLLHRVLAERSDLNDVLFKENPMVLNSSYATFVRQILALQLLFCFEVRSLSERLVSSTPE